MRFDEKSPIFPDNSNNHDLDGSDWRVRVGERGFTLGELEPEIVDVLGARLDTPRSEGFGGQSGLEPVGEGLRGCEAVSRVRVFAGHGVDSEKTTRVLRERDWRRVFGKEIRVGFGGRNKEEERESSEDEIRESCGFLVKIAWNLGLLLRHNQKGFVLKSVLYYTMNGGGDDDDG